ncbi:bacterial Ig-like domain-containing protein [Enterococcus villorum]|uniref:Uncharacterized protein n=2 Tax=Enterococcus villorum TaxID=112904 RepID=A0A511J490_9ENTE|nr:bacterial Ig-like domain-containing protein [Enterococcus villorum]EOH92078.1 hypothetical protein UAO_00528 [Enterococcus villorum ATCC 700913]EOW76574.1 hypothetical protein I591_01882 [Enterococcus villorum ATCC 700913]GEL92828.1 hypothetical protein EVI01_21650 [Enterococcus villorum]
MKKKRYYPLLFFGIIGYLLFGLLTPTVAADYSKKIGSLTITVTGKTINETISNKPYEIANITFEVPDNTVSGKEYTINHFELYKLSFYNPTSKRIPLSESGITLDPTTIKIIDETGKDWTSFFNIQNDGSIPVIRSFPDGFYGHTYTMKLYGSIDHPKDYSSYIKDGYLNFPNVYYRLLYKQMGFEPFTGDTPFLSDQYIKFLIYTVNANYIDENKNKLVDTIEYGGYSGDTYQTLEKEIPGYHLIQTEGNTSGEFTKEPITVNYIYRKNLYSIDAKDTTIYVGENWNPEDNFVSATDIDGHALSFEDSGIRTEGSVDPTTPGVYSVIYKNQTAQKEVKVTVKKRDLLLTVPETTNFGQVKLGSHNLLFWPSENAVTVQDESNSSWDLSIKLASTALPDFTNFLTYNGHTLSTQMQSIASGTGNMEVSNQKNRNEFIYIDYSEATSLRKDQAILEWALTPSTKGVLE